MGLLQVTNEGVLVFRMPGEGETRAPILSLEGNTCRKMTQVFEVLQSSHGAGTRGVLVLMVLRSE